MPGVAVENISDVITTTLRKLGRLKFTNLAFDLQRYHALPHIFKRKKKGVSGGYGDRFNVLAEDSGAARDTLLYEVDTVPIQDVATYGFVPFRNTETSYGFDVREQAFNQPGFEQIVDLVQMRRAASLTSLAKHMEARLWGQPDDSSDERKAYGLKYWFTSSTTKGFNGGNKTNFSAGPANLNCDTHDAWKHWTGRYAARTQDDLGDLMRECAEKIDFTSPIDCPEYDRGKPDMYLYMNYDTKADIKKWMEQQNDQLGRDVDSAEGRVTFQGHPMSYVPFLDGATGDPVLFVDWTVLFPIFQNGWWMKETKPYMSPGQHNGRRVHIDFVWNLRCHNRRRLGLIDSSSWST